MNCSWCSYVIGDDEPIYNTFDIYNRNSGMRFCSINCCSAYITTDKYESITNINKKLDFLYEYYGINTIIADAKNPKRLKKFGGDLTYEQYRCNFVFPKVPEYKNSFDIKNEYYDFEDDYDRLKRESEYLDYYEKEFYDMQKEKQDVEEIEKNND